MSGRGHKMVFLALSNPKNVNTADASTLESNQEHTSTKPTSVPKPWGGETNDTGEIWKQFDHEYESFLKLNDAESMDRLKEYYCDFSYEVTAAAEHPNLEEANKLPQLPSYDCTQYSQQIDSPRISDTNNADKFNSELDSEGSSLSVPSVLQNLDDSIEDPDFDYDSSMIITDSDEENSLKEYKRKKKNRIIGHNVTSAIKLPASQHVEAPQSDNEQPTETYQDDDRDSKRKTRRVTQRDKNTRKKTRNVSNWLKTQAKYKRNTGQHYWSTSSKAYVPGRALGITCDGKTCRFKCSEKISDAERQSIFSRFWQIGDLNRQREFLRRQITDVNRPLSILGNKRATNQAFYLEVTNKKNRVCKNFFIATLGISHRWITTVREKTADGFLQADRRGHHDNHKKVNDEILNDMRAHIQSIPRIESHYLREQTTKEYIEGGKSIKSIYCDYVKFCKEQSKTFGSEDKFRRIFDTEFNISFYIPKKDQCDFCVAFDNMSPEEKEQRKEEHELHLVNKTIAREEKERDKTNTEPNVIVCTYDLQKSLVTPNGDVSQFYYKSKLSTYNFTIYELKTKQGYCNVWHEGDAKRGSIEIATCVFKYIHTKVKDTPGDEPLDFIFFSDNCGGQQKNKFMILMYMCATLKFPRVASITHKFLVSGHTQNEGDNMHSLIEKEIKRARKSGPIYIPAQYVQLIRSSKKNSPYYLVREFTHSDFIDFKSLQKHVGDNFNVNREGGKVSFNNIVAIKIIQETPLSFFYKLSFKEEFKEIPVNEHIIELKTNNPSTEKRRSARTIVKKYTEEDNTSTIEKKKETIREWNSPAYDQPCGIAQKKKKDIVSLINGVLIPAVYKDFYLNLAVRKDTNKSKATENDDLEDADVD